jgi:hypothetical protein
LFYCKRRCELDPERQMANHPKRKTGHIVFSLVPLLVDLKKL